MSLPKLIISHLFNIIHLWNVELQHVLYAAFQGNFGTGTACARANQLQLHCAILKALKDDISTILLDSRPENQGTYQDAFLQSCAVPHKSPAYFW